MTVPIQIQNNQIKERLDYVEELLGETQEIANRTERILVTYAEQNRQNVGAVNYLAMVVADRKERE